MKQEMKTRLVRRAIWENVRKEKNNQVIVNSNWVQLTTSNAPVAFMNGVFRCELDNKDAEQQIINAINSYKSQNLPFRWKICETSKPKHLEEVLISNGMVLKDLLLGLIALPGQIKLPKNPDVEVKLLSLDLKNDWPINSLPVANFPK